MSPAAAPLVEFFFEFSSPYSYLASTRIEEICARHGADLQWRPIVLGPILKETGRQPLFHRPGEGEYARKDLLRWAERLGIPLRHPPVFPIQSLAAARGARVAQETGAEAAYCRRVLEVAWGEGRDVGDLVVLKEAAASVGVDPARLEAGIADPAVKAWLREQTDEAARRGLFGVPTCYAYGESFWGNDRLFMLEELLAERSHPALPSTTPFNRWFGLRCLSRGEGRAEYELNVTGSLLNRRGVAHGGAVTSLLDSALGTAVVAGIGPEEWCATLELSVQFREGIPAGRIVGRGRMVKRGRHAAFAEGEVVDAAGKTLASAHGTWYVWSRKPVREGSAKAPSESEGR